MKYKAAATTALIILLTVLAGAQMLGQDEWPMFRHDKERTGLVEDALHIWRPNPIWVFPYPRDVEGIIDNDYGAKDDPGFETTGAWSETPVGAFNAHDDDYLHTFADSSASATAVWTFTWDDPAITASSADFYIYVWLPNWSPQEDKPRIPDAHYTVRINGTVVGTYYIDQTSGGTWLGIGQRAFHVPPAAIQTIEVILSNKTRRLNEDGDALDLRVFADAVRVEQDAGMVYSSPVASEAHPLLISCVTKSVSLDWISGVSESKDYGVVYAIGTEGNSNIPGPQSDDRGFMKWRFPEEDRNWIERGISSSPAIYGGGNERAVIAGADGTVYVVRTETGELIWRGPGYFRDDPDSRTNGAENWIAGTGSGYQDYGGSTYWYAKTVAAGSSVSTAEWKATVGKKGPYAIYAWIPPAPSGMTYSSAARYRITVGGAETSLSQGQGRGGGWVRLGRDFSAEAGDEIAVLLSNEESGGVIVPPGGGAPPTESYVVADAVKIVPAGIGSFEFSSPVVDRSNDIYIGSTGGRVLKLRVGAPDPVWIFPDPNNVSDPHPIGPVYASPAFEEEDPGGLGQWIRTVYIGSADGHVYAIDGQNGTQKWVYPSKAVSEDPTELPELLPQISSTTALGQYIYVGLGGWGSQGYSFDPEGRVLALTKSGSVAWWYPNETVPQGKGAFLYSSPLLMQVNPGGVATPGVFIGSTDGMFYGINSQTGEGLIESGSWALSEYPRLGSGTYSSAAGTICDQTMDEFNAVRINAPVAFVGSNGGRISRVLLHGTAPTRDWWWDLFGGVQSSPAIKTHRIYVGDMAGYTWAFSTRDDGSGGGVEGWNWEIGGPPPTTGSEDDDSSAGPATPKIATFTAKRYEAVVQAARTSKDNQTAIVFPEGKSDLYELSESADQTTDDPIAHEWGEDICVIVWDLCDPNIGSGIQPWDTDGKTLRDYSGHRVSISIKSEEPGRDADNLHTHTIQGGSTNYFVNSEGKAVFYATYRYVLDGSAPGRPQTPSRSLTISCKETPATTLSPKRSSSDDIYVKRHGSDQIQFFAIHNPLGLSVDSYRIGVTGSPISGFETSRQHSDAPINGTAQRPRPYAWGGYTSHNTSSTPYEIAVCDRSLVGAFGRAITHFRMQPTDLYWRGGRWQVISPIDDTWMSGWEMPPADTRTGTPNISEDYPDIPSRQLSAPMPGGDPTAGPVQLNSAFVYDRANPPTPPGPTESWQAGVKPSRLAVSVPRFQPANMIPPNMTGNTEMLRYTGYRASVFAYVDSDRDGRFDAPAQLGMVSANRKSSQAEAYREFRFGIHVPPDRRVRVEGTMMDIGEVPHGFGVVPDGPGGQPAAFWNALGANLNDFDRWFRDFTAYNIGNTNLLNLRMAAARPGLVSDTVQDPSSAPGFVIPGTSEAVQPGERDSDGACVVSSLDPLFWDDTNPFWPNRPRTFHKARVGEIEPMLTVPDLPERLYRTVGFNQQDHLPRVSVAVPLGQPVGRYYGALTFFEDGLDGAPDGVYGQGESVGDPVMNLQVRVQEARLTDGFLPGSAPHLDVAPVALGPGNVPVITGDINPVAYRDLVTGNMHVIWASSRYGRDVLGNPEPQATDPWYLHISSLPVLAPAGPNPLRQWQFFSPTEPRWWLPTDWNASGGAGAPFPPPSDVNNLFPWPVNPSTVRFTNPSVAIDRGAAPPVTTLFFGGQAEPAAGPVAGSREKPIASKAFYVQLNDGSPVGDLATSTHDWTMPKFGIRGAVSRIPGIPQPSPAPMLWSFWYGGSSDRWSIYYTVNPEPDNPDAWRNEAQLPVPRGLVSVAEPSPVFRWWAGQTLPTLDVVYSGYSVFHRNTDIYLSRYAPDSTAAVPLRGGHWPLRMLALPSRAAGARVGSDTVPGEALTRDAATAVWHSRDVDWADGYEVFAYPDPDDPSVRHKLNVGRPERDNTTGALAYDYSDNATLRQLYRAVVINPAAGTVKLLKAPDPRTVIVARYSPRAYRVSLSGAGVDVAPDVSPCALMDDSPNPRYNPASLGNPFFPSCSDGCVAPPTDRFWTFWRRPGLDKPGTGIHYKAFRYAVQLGPQIAVDTSTKKPLIDDVRVNGAEPAFPVEVDWMKNRLYFASEDAWTVSGGNVVPGMAQVSYVSADGNDIQDQLPIVFVEDQVGLAGSGSTTFGTMTSVMVNEGQVQAFKDPVSNKLWVFWTSTRDGSTDVFYSAISPKFYGEQL